MIYLNRYAAQHARDPEYAARAPLMLFKGKYLNVLKRSNPGVSVLKSLHLCSEFIFF